MIVLCLKIWVLWLNLYSLSVYVNAEGGHDSILFVFFYLLESRKLLFYILFRKYAYVYTVKKTKAL